ncbi:hypothetical protein STENM223S_08161 [Streptomyces tendae]
MGLLDDKVVLVNGGSQGVGAAVARAAVREGAVVAVSGRRAEPGEALVAELAGHGAKAMSYAPTSPTPNRPRTPSPRSCGRTAASTAW